MFFQGAPYQQGKDGKTLVYYGVTPFLVVVTNPNIMLQTFHSDPLEVVLCIKR